MTLWVPPDDIDPECIPLCRAINALPGLETYESCCGHERRDPFRIWFFAKTVEALRPLTMCVEPWYGGDHRWKIKPQVIDLGPPYVVFQLYFGGRMRGLKLYAEADNLAHRILGTLALVESLDPERSFRDEERD